MFPRYGDRGRQRLGSVDPSATLRQSMVTDEMFSWNREAVATRQPTNNRYCCDCSLMGDVLVHDAATAASDVMSVSAGLPTKPSSSLNIVIPPCHQMIRI